MFDDSSLVEHIKHNHTLKLRSVVLAEFNMNDTENIAVVGNYRYRPLLISDTTSLSPDSLPIETAEQSTDFRKLVNIFDINDREAAFTDATKSFVYTELGYVNDSILTSLTEDQKMSMTYDLEACFGSFRPRSGINKLFLNPERRVFTDMIRSGERPRYYFASKNDKFKYWNSYRQENQATYGISNPTQTGSGYQIQDVAPFVVYESPVPVNKLSIKVQTHIGSYQVSSPDRHYGQENATVPVRWRVQCLQDNGIWETVYTFNEVSTRQDGSPIFRWDGTVELKYGFSIPTKYKDSFFFVDYIDSVDLLPPLTGTGYLGEAYGVVTDETAGTMYVRTADAWDSFPIEYGFELLEDNDYGERSSLKTIVNPPYFVAGTAKRYREFMFIKGIRIVVDSMNTPNTPFELIEMSPRLLVDLTDCATSFSFNKSMIDGDKLPVGSLLASNGSISLTNFKLEFAQLNEFNNGLGSIIASHLKPNVKFIFFEGIRGVGIYEKLIPIKWLYAEDFPKTTYQTDAVNVNLRDLFFLLEGQKAPELFFRNITLTAAICILLDSIGFSNYRFIGFDGNDPIIPNFFVGSDQNVAEVLRNIAVATQSAMFFDEYNNFTVYSKEWIFDNRDKVYDLNINEPVTYSAGKWVAADGEEIGIPNVEGFVSEDNSVINDGEIKFTSRYIQRSITKIKQTSLSDEDRVYNYKPVLLWEAAPTEAEKTINDAVATQSGFVLGAMALNSGITDKLPEVVDGEIINNIIDVGANIYWAPRAQGYLYANGEIIKYDAIEYILSGRSDTVWIKDNKDYQYYFGNMPFGGIMFPTGNIRIYAEPYYQTINDVVTLKPGPVRLHGRGQFGTKIVEHFAGIPDEWVAAESVFGIATDSSPLFAVSKTTRTNTFYSESTITRGVAPNQPTYAVATAQNFTPSEIAARSKRSDIIKNFMSTKTFVEAGGIETGNGIQKKNSVYNQSPVNSSALRASALVFTGPQQFDTFLAKNFVTVVKKQLDQQFTHFGTRVRIIGEISNNDNTIQSPLGAMQYFTVTPENTEDSVTVSGGSGGIAIMLDGEAGYFLEIMSLTDDVTKQFLDFSGASEEFKLDNIALWKKSGDINVTKLWGGTGNVLIDTGTFVGQDRAVIANTPTVYDISIEYVDRAGSRFFNIYINNRLIASNIEDTSPLRVTPVMGLFVRGSSKLMFENVFAVGYNPAVAQASNDFTIGEYIRSDLNPESLSDVFRKFSMNQFVSDSYLTMIGTETLPKYNLFYEEFGTIMRECFHFDVKYDNAYPALYARVAPTFNKERRYSVAGFKATPYGAEFLVFNNTDKALVLDESTGSFLRISGIAFTQSTSYQYTVDEYFKKASNFTGDSTTVDRNIYAQNPDKLELSYRDIKSSRNKYGIQAFSVESDYIQSWSQAESLMAWLIEKKFEQKESYSLDMFGVPHLQLGDIVSIRYKQEDKYMIDPDKKFVIVSIDHSRSETGMATKLKVVEA